MIHLHQLNKTRNCGQIAVACLTDTPYEKVFEIVGHSHGTKTRELIAALRKLNWKCFDSCQSVKRFTNQPVRCLAQVHSNEHPGWHWVAIGDAVVYDGNLPCSMILQDYVNVAIKDYYGESARITSYLPAREVEQSNDTRR